MQVLLMLFRKCTLILGTLYSETTIYPMAPTDVIIRPWSGQVSKIQARWRMDTFNRHVDEYISMGNDHRQKLDIEIASKIGINGGPLYKHCEAIGCNNREKRDVDKMRGCGGCKAVSTRTTLNAIASTFPHDLPLTEFRYTTARRRAKHSIGNATECDVKKARTNLNVLHHK